MSDASPLESATGFSRLRPSAALVATWRRSLSRIGTYVRALPYLSRWILLAPTIGVIAGLGAALFYETLSAATHLFLGILAGYHPPLPAGEGAAAGSAHYVRAWVIPLVVTLGGILSGWLVFTFAPEAEGHGTDAAIDAVHHNPRAIRFRAVVVKIVASAITIGSGGSGGREGPTAQISAGFGSLLARVLDLSPEDGRVAVSVGIGSGIGAIFGAPLGGAVLAADVVYRDDFEIEALIPGVFASIIAYAVFGAFFGYHPLFAIFGGYRFHAVQLAWFALVGLLSGGIGLLYSKSFYGVVGLSARLPFTKKLRPALGALAVGLMALWLPEVLGTGYGWVQKGLSNQLGAIPVYVIILLPLARIAATAFSIGTGGSGGVFGPGMVIGAFTGLAVWRIFEPISSSVGHQPAAFVVVGMMAVFGGISRAPLAVMLMVAEMTGSISLLAPAMVAVAIATFVVTRSDDSIYRSQLRSRADSPSGRISFAMPLISSLQISQVMQSPKLLFSRDLPVKTAFEQVEEFAVPGAPVLDSGIYLGAVERDRLAQAAEDEPEVPVERIADPTATSVPSGARLDVALDALVQSGRHWLAVTSDSREVVGIVTVRDVVRGYQQALRQSARQISQVATHSVVVEERVGPSSPLVGETLRHAGLPPRCIVLTLQRRNDLIFARASTAIEAEDIISALCEPQTAEGVRSLIRGEPTDDSDSPPGPPREAAMERPGARGGHLANG